LLTILQIHGLQPWQRTPGVVEVPVGERQHVHVARLQRLTNGVLFETATLAGVSSLEAFTRIDDSDAIGPFDQTAADRTIGRGPGGSGTENVHVNGHAHSPQD
jgi:hypothetical protein